MKDIYNIVKAPVGWCVFCDGVRLGGIHGTKEAALEAAAVAGSFSIRDGQGIQINVPEDAGTLQQSSNDWTAPLK